MKRNKIFRIATSSHSFRATLKGQFKYIKEKGFDYILICTKDDLIDDVAVEEEAKYLPLTLTRKITPLNDLKALFVLIFYILKEKPEIVHTHSPKAGLIGMLAAFICRVPKRIHTVAGLPLVEKTGVVKKILIMCEKITYLCSSVIFFNSRVQADYVLKEGWVSKSKSKVIGEGSSNGIDLSYFDPGALDEQKLAPIKKQYELSDNDFVICYIGRMASAKGINELVKSFVDLEKRYDNLKLILVGEEEPKEPLEPKIYETISNDDNIIRIDHQKDIRPYLSLSDIFILPSYREGFPQVIMQACAMKCCIICTDINGCNEMIKHNFNGLLIAPKSVQEINIAVEKLIDNPDLRSRFKGRARSYIEENFSQQEFWNKLSMFYLNDLTSNGD
ncbi:glycosyltransferase family 4 protein [Pedobacter africanus]|uniref:glycosyltransferase family 4 protein n=1 Tax=Pedobacter africanus TaxID=151894 RepID=UPI0013564A47|nr:glycosyltransferase family 4 protein [Pedobacter africanus]